VAAGPTITTSDATSNQKFVELRAIMSLPSLRAVRGCRPGW
jgi:hypothetical protein